MCLAIAGEIINLDNNYALVDIMGIKDKVNIQLLDYPKVGDYILIHTGFAIEIINKEYFNYLNKVFNEMIKKEEENE
ncbi:MAG: HypC/HybG/HupF family hydrogenase formation chaperone [Firmicutes bacterium]|nr:HypC/HybG/HupF family hydrogenase formation chaperone [Bacillota bacterium]